MSRDKWVTCTKRLADMYARDLRPIRVVDGPVLFNYIQTFKFTI